MLDGTKRKKRRKSPATPRAQRKGVNFGQMLNDAKTPAMFLVGMFVGKQVSTLIAKPALKGVEGLLGVDAAQLLKPAILIGGGLAVAQMSSNFKTIGYGIAAYGGVTVAKDLLKTNLLAGIDGSEEEIGYLASDTTLPELDDAMKALRAGMSGDETIEGMGNAELIEGMGNAELIEGLDNELIEGIDAELIE